MKIKSFFTALVVALLFSTTVQAEPLRVVASFSILGDMAQVVGGDDVVVTTLVGRDADAHAYLPDVEAAKAVANADLVVANGLGFDAWLGPLVGSAGFKGTIVIASQGIEPRMLKTATGLMADPHAWQDLRSGRKYVENIANAMATLRPKDASKIMARAKRYDEDIQKMDIFVQSTLLSVQIGDRKIVTSHDAFGYLGKAYEITFLAPQGLSTEGEASSADVVALINQIKRERIRTIFVESIKDPRLVQQISYETGAAIGKPLYSDSLSKKNGPADTYLKMFHYNIRLMKEAMQGK